MWTKQETDALEYGIAKHGVGSWKAILSDPEIHDKFHPSRNEVSLKDRYRIVWGSRSSGKSARSPTKKRKRKWTEDEDKESLEFFKELGPQWTEISRRSSSLLQNNRSGIDVRDRIRTKYPDLYTQSPMRRSSEVPFSMFSEREPLFDLPPIQSMWPFSLETDSVTPFFDETTFDPFFIPE